MRQRCTSFIPMICKRYLCRCVRAPSVTHGARYRQLLADSQSAVAKQNTSSVFVAVTLAMFTGQLLYGLAVLILPQYARSNGISQGSLGLLVGSYSAASLFVSPLLSLACTRYGRRNVLLCGLIGLAMSTVLFAVSTSVLLLALARIVQGVSAAANFTAGQAVLAHTFAGQSLGSILGSAAG